MEVRPMHTYALVTSDSQAVTLSLVDRLSAKPERKVSKASAVGTVKSGFTCMLSVSDKDRPQKNVFIVGHDSGAIYVWRRQRFVGKEDDATQDKSKGPQAVLPSSAHDQLRDPRYRHKGPVQVLKMQPVTQFIYSGASDRTIKLWDIFDPEHPPCLRQTFTGHGGSVTCIEFAPHMPPGQSPGYMMSGSTDMTIIIWKNAEGREMMLYPFYIKFRVIDLKVWPSTLLFLSTRHAQGDLYIGDAAGKIQRMVFDHSGGSLRDTEPRIWSAGLSSHGLGILSMVAEPHEGIMLSISNDTTVKVWENVSGANKKTLKNENRVRFNAVHVDPTHQDVYLVDDKGHLVVWNWVTERTIISQCLTDGSEPLLSVAVNPSATELYLQTPTRIDSYMMVRGMAHVALRGHTEPVLGLAFVSPDSEDMLSEQEVLYSCALDNTLRSWDPISLECSFVLKETADTEMSCMGVLPRISSIVTGNDDGSLRLWDLATGKHSICTAHSNTISALATCHTAHRHHNASSAHHDEGGTWAKDLIFTCGFDGEVVSWEVITTRIKNPAFVKSSIKTDLHKLISQEADRDEANLQHADAGHVSYDSDELSQSSPPRTKGRGGQLGGDSSGGEGEAEEEGGRGGKDKKEKEFLDATRKLSPMGRSKAHKAEILCCAHIFPLDHTSAQYPNGMLLTAGNDCKIKRWAINDRLDLELDAQLTAHDAAGNKVINCHADAISCMAVDGNFVFTGSDDTTIKIWNMSGEPSWHPSGPMLDHCLVRVLDAPAGGHVEAIKALLIIQPQGLLVSLSIDMVIKIWDYTRGVVLWETKHDKDDLTCIIFDQAKQTLVCGTEQHTIVTVDVPDLDRLVEAANGGGDSEQDEFGEDEELKPFSFESLCRQCEQASVPFCCVLERCDKRIR